MQDEREYLEQKVRDVQGLFSEQTYRDYLDFLIRCPGFAGENSLLIFAQNPDASLLMGFEKWKQNGRYVRSGEKGIAVLLPAKFSSRIRRAVPDENGEIKEQMVTREVVTLRRGYLYDISQTEGRELSEHEINSLKNENFEQLIHRVRQAVQPAKICIEPDVASDGYFDAMSDTIFIGSGLSQTQTMKMALYGLVHRSLYQQGGSIQNIHSIWRMEVKTMVYLLCRKLDINVPEMRFPNAGEWVRRMEPDIFVRTMRLLTKMANEFADQLETVPALEKKQEYRMTLQEQLDFLNKLSIEKNFPTGREENEKEI